MSFRNVKRKEPSPGQPPTRVKGRSEQQALSDLDARRKAEDVNNTEQQQRAADSADNA